ncbi:hypothetical protein I7I51_04985 [Histoplasma capsulatum]|uniref:Uncharacterized protein n=1 Tax=Ajellomyces capsulatus TaxID=5037 RepID=A0A8A1M148_AJECA|nr:hypothetical protein I7I51_04985 [Histoplasma capsulatum]
MVQLWKTESSYKECNQSDSDESEENPPKSVSHFFWAAIFIGLIAFGALLIVLAPKNWLRGNSCVFASGSKEVSSSPQQQNDEDLVMDCGKTRAEAVARGCVLDIMGAAWLPQLCYDKELAEESVSPDTELAKVGGSGISQWWRNYNRTVEISQDRLQYLDDLVGYTWEEFHVAHCLYDWRALVKAAKRIRKGERNVEVIANQDHRAGATAKVDFALGKCVRLDMY